MALQSTTALSTITLQASSSSVNFTGIPSTYRDLILTLTGSPSDTSYPVIALRFNSDSGTNYAYVGMTGNGSTAGAGSNGSQNYLSIGQGYGTGPNTSSIFNTVVYIVDYSTTNKNKLVLSRNNVAGTGVEAQSSRWANTSAITSISVITTSGAFAAGSTFSLYGRIS